MSLGGPILAGQLGMIVTGFADTYMVGQYSTEALASASFVNGIFNCGILACVGFSYGLTPLVGALFTQRRDADIGATLRAGVRANMIFSAALTALFTVLYFMLDKMGQPEELLPFIRPYYLTILVSVVFISLFNAFAQCSYGVQRTRMPMWIVLGANALNILLNRLLIYGDAGMPELGLTGAGLATLISRMVCAAGIIAVFAASADFRVYTRGFRTVELPPGKLKQVWSTSWPVAMQMALETGAFSGAAVMAGWLGKIELAAFQIVVIIGMLGFCVYYSVAAAVSVLVANACGASDRRGMRRVALDGYVIILVLAALASLTFIFFLQPLAHIFTPDPKVIATTLSLLVPLLLYQLGDATQITFANALRGTSRVQVMSWIALVSYAIIGLPSTYLFAFTLGAGLPGIVYSFSVSLFTAAALFVYFFRRYTSGAG